MMSASAFNCRGESADGSLRTLVLSVEDHVKYLDGRRAAQATELHSFLHESMLVDSTRIVF